MKKLLLTIVISIISSSSNAQWEWQNPLPQGNSLFGICFVDENHGWAVGSRKTLMHTTDGGLTWETQESGMEDILGFPTVIYDIYFTDLLNGWAVGGSPSFILHTEDGGNTWLSSPRIDETRFPSYLTDVWFVDQQTGWALGSMWIIPAIPSIIHTTNGGETWESQNCGLTDVATGICFINQLEGWIVGSTIIHTIDGGLNWELQDSITDSYLTDVFFIDSNYGWAIGNEGTVLITSNGGEIWESSIDSSLSGINLRNVSFINANTGWVGGYDDGTQHGVILKSTDGGFTWDKQLPDQQLQPVYCLTYKNESEGFAAGGSGEIYKADDSGDNWSKISSSVTSCDFKDVFFIDANKGWAAGEDSYTPFNMPDPNIFHTNNGGVTWERQNVPNAESGGYYKIFFSDEQHGWSFGYSIDGGFEYLISTTDAGDNWEVQITEDSVSSDMYFINNSVGWKVGFNGAIQKSEDGGWNWEEQISGTSEHLFSVFFIDDNKGWIAGDSTILSTENGGETWEEQFTAHNIWRDIFFIDDLRGWTTSPGRGYSCGKTMKTIDGGQTWEEIYDCGFHEMFFADTENGWGRSRTSPLGGASSPPYNNIWSTHDGGLTWNIQPLQALIYGGFCFIDSNEGWAVSNNGTILHTTNGGISNYCLPEGITFTTQTQIDSFQILYPNCTEIEGNVFIGAQMGTDITNLDGLSALTTIGGGLQIANNSSLINLVGLSNLTYIQGYLRLGIGFMGLHWGNDALTNLEGFDNLDSIGEYIYIAGNSSLLSLSGLENLSSIGDGLSIWENHALTSLTGLENIDAGSITKLIISGNTNLSACDIQSICDYIANPNGEIIIEYNASGCNSQEEVEEACSSCLPEGITFTTQAQIDSFQIMYPNCTEIEGEVRINGLDITNLNGLSNLTSIGNVLEIGSLHGGCPSLTNLSGLENLTSVGNMEISNNTSLLNLFGLSNLTTLWGYICLTNNSSLINLSGLEGLDSIASLRIWNNDALTSLSGLDNLTSFRYYGPYGSLLLINDNDALVNLTGLKSLTSFNKGMEGWESAIRIVDNNALVSLEGIENIDVETVQNLSIRNNSSLSVCEAQWVCSFLSDTTTGISIENNDPGCNTQQEVEEACASSIHEIGAINALTVSPNPFTASTTLSYELQQPDKVSLSVYNHLGQIVYQTQENQQQGKQQLIWNAEGYADGIYYYKLQAGDKIANGKLVKVM